MSPFSEFLIELRSRHNIKQAELARRLGYAKSYISALETGEKGPPNQMFLRCLADYFALSERETAELHAAANASQRSLTIPTNSPIEMYHLCSRLRRLMPAITESEVRALHKLMDLMDELQPAQHRPQQNAASPAKPDARN